MDNTLRLINDGDSILFISYNEFIHKIIKSLNKQKNNLTVYLILEEVENIKEEILTTKNTNNLLIVITSLGSMQMIIPKVDKVFSGCQTVYLNSSVLANSGTSICGIICSKLRKPFYLICSIFQFVAIT